MSGLGAAFSAADFERFLVAIDEHLDVEVHIVVVGGTAAGIAYSVTKRSTDIDTHGTVGAALFAAAAKARTATGLQIPVNPAAVFTAPDGWEDRLQAPLPQLQRLRVWVPDPYDLVLSKLARGEAHDMEAMVELSGAQGLDLNMLIERYLTDMRPTMVADPARVDLSVEVFVGDAFGEEAGRALGKKLTALRKGK